MPETKRGILAVSFGTSHNDTCAKTIDVIENEMREAYPDCPVYRAWTSGMIRKKLEMRDGVHIFSVKEALEQMKKDGITEAVVQPTHVLNGIENDLMLKAVEEAKDLFEKTAVGDALLTTQKDCEELVKVLAQEWKLKDNEMVVFMGHGTEHYSDFVYAALNYQFQIKDHVHMAMGTVEGFPTIADMVDAVKRQAPEKVFLAPFMIVAGDHANNDLAGDDEESWKRIFEKEGYEVQCVLKGLGEYPGVRAIFREHLGRAIKDIDGTI